MNILTQIFGREGGSLPSFFAGERPRSFRISAQAMIESDFVIDTRLPEDLVDQDKVYNHKIVLNREVKFPVHRELCISFITIENKPFQCF